MLADIDCQRTGDRLSPRIVIYEPRVAADLAEEADAFAFVGYDADSLRDNTLRSAFAGTNS
jgi:hypothetical protein